MTVRTLIKALKKMPQNANVGVSVFDGYGIEAGGWVNKVRLIDKSDPEMCAEAEFAFGFDPYIVAMFESAPEKYVLLIVG